MPVFARRPDLLRGFRRGDRTALETVYRDCLPDVTAVVTHMCGSREGDSATRVGPRRLPIADCVQEVFFRAFSPQARAAFDERRAYRPYLQAIARHVVIDEVRRQRREVPTEWTDLEMLAQAPREGMDEALSVSFGAVVRRFVQELEPDMRALHDARYARGLSQQQAAAELGLSRQRVRTLEANLHADLRRTLARGRRPARPALIPQTSFAVSC
jgi:RNA polymerase sigma factor (sigma-70 family)